MPLWAKYIFIWPLQLSRVISSGHHVLDQNEQLSLVVYLLGPAYSCISWMLFLRSTTDVVFINVFMRWRSCFRDNKNTFQ